MGNKIKAHERKKSKQRSFSETLCNDNSFEDVGSFKKDNSIVKHIPKKNVKSGDSKNLATGNTAKDKYDVTLEQNIVLKQRQANSKKRKKKKRTKNQDTTNNDLMSVTKKCKKKHNSIETEKLIHSNEPVIHKDNEHKNKHKTILNSKFSINKLEVLINKKMEYNKVPDNTESLTSHSECIVSAKERSLSENVKEEKKSLSLRNRMMMQLKASRFRFLNEAFYTSEGSEAKEYFKENPNAFVAYHEGYKQQVERWPVNPLDIMISNIKKLPTDYIIADFGCGEARLAASVPHKVYSIDLVSTNEKVIACDMAHTQLLMESVHVVVFCLSLMGTNLHDYILEANRILKKDGIIKIAEVESRFDNVEDFIRALNEYGFTNTWKDLTHNLFYFMDFKKDKEIRLRRNQLPYVTLKPCLYKKR